MWSQWNSETGEESFDTSALNRLFYLRSGYPVPSTLSKSQDCFLLKPTSQCSPPMTLLSLISVILWGNSNEDWNTPSDMQHITRRSSVFWFATVKYLFWYWWNHFWFKKSLAGSTNFFGSRWRAASIHPPESPESPELLHLLILLCWSVKRVHFRTWNNETEPSRSTVFISTSAYGQGCKKWGKTAFKETVS